MNVRNHIRYCLCMPPIGHITPLTQSAHSHHSSQFSEKPTLQAHSAVPQTSHSFRVLLACVKSEEQFSTMPSSSSSALLLLAWDPRSVWPSECPGCVSWLTLTLKFDPTQVSEAYQTPLILKPIFQIVDLMKFYRDLTFRKKDIHQKLQILCEIITQFWLSRLIVHNW